MPQGSAALTARGLILAAPASGSGKTVVTAALLRAFRSRGVRVAAAKSGPDYIDPGFHAAATGRPTINLDPWAMREETIAALAAGLADGTDLVLCEGAMGLFDGIDARGTGSCADLAAMTGWPVVLVVDVRGQSASAAALVAGFARHRRDVTIAGVIFNRIGGAGHKAVLDEALAATCPAIARLGAVPRDPKLALPERHLGLVQARELAAIESVLAYAAERIAASIDLDALGALARPALLDAPSARPEAVPPLGQRIAVAQDDAFAFAYPTMLETWRAAGATLAMFSPLANEAPAADCDAVFLPGGYPELHAGRIAANPAFLDGMRAAAARGAAIYGECGGYMVLGRSLTDAEGKIHRMADLLPVETSFRERRLNLGYRTARLLAASPFGPAGTTYRGHEFHYATAQVEDGAGALFEAFDAVGGPLGPVGLHAGKVMGSFIHLIDCCTAKTNR